MPSNCCVAGCPNKKGLKLNDDYKIHFYSILCTNKEKRKLWLQAIPLRDSLKNYSSEKELQNVRICGRHFISGKKSPIDNEDYVPSIFNFTSEAERQAIIDRQRQKSSEEEDPLNKEKQVINPLKRNTLKCKHCPRYFANDHMLSLHEKQTHELRECKHCPKVFSNKNYFMRHQRVHSDDRPYVCESCGWRSKSLGALRVHTQSRHTGKGGDKEDSEKKVKNERRKCKECGEWLSDASCLIRHQLLHMSEKSFVCDLCGKQFARRDYLRAHMRKHTGEKRFCCTLCVKAFTDKRYLDNHMQKVHKASYLSKDTKQESPAFSSDDIKQENEIIFKLIFDAK